MSQPASPELTLTPAQEQVLALIASGSTALAAAAAAGVHRNTVANWRQASPAFRDALAASLYDQAIFWREQTQLLAESALETIRAILADPAAPAGVRLKAALAILDRASAPLPACPTNRADFVHNPAHPPSPETEKTNPMPPVTPSIVKAGPPAPAAPVSQTPQSVPNPNPPRPAAKTGRNDVCPCGSGLKFKRCCLGKAA